MDLNPIGIMQGRLLPPTRGRIQAFPVGSWREEFHSAAQIGVDGPATIENSWIGKNAIVGNLGPVTLKDTVVGPQTILGSGVAENAVFLGKETMISDFTTGFGFRVRKGSLYEEDSSSAHHTDTKMTVLFPWNTLGSNINFCDALIAGGTGPELGNFSEVGSCLLYTSDAADE